MVKENIDGKVISKFEYYKSYALSGFPKRGVNKSFVVKKSLLKRKK